MTGSEVNYVGIAGLGILGRSIAASLLAHGFQVVAFTRSHANRKRAVEAIAASLEELSRSGLTPAGVGDWQRRYREASHIGDLGGSEFVIESIAEDLDAKNQLFDELEDIIGDTVVVASNTSALPISVIQGRRHHPERFVGMHWAEPGYASRFLEVIPGDKTTDEALNQTVELGRRLGKEPSVLQKDVPGFIANRLAYAMYREAFHLEERGVADRETIDRSFRNACGLWASLCGPFRWMDLTGGPALYVKAMRSVLPDLSNATDVPEAIQKLYQEESQGIVNESGFYDYTVESADTWRELFHKHVWKVHRWMEDEFPMDRR